MKNRVALIAYSVRFPGTDTQRFWGDLLAKKDLVTHVDSSRWSQDTFFHPDKRHPGTSYSFAAGSIGDVSGFDAAFFGISPREASQMDPQQRILLELAWETLENAGIAPSALRGSDCGIYLGLSNVDYAYRMLDDFAAIEAGAATGMVSSIATNRMSYIFDWHGPSISIDTACSSALVAFHQACRAIRSGEISQAMTGGINLHLHPYPFVSFAKATMLSKSGRCHVFDESADGYVRSEGGGLFFLKNYEQAVADGDPILALVVGSAVNTDGHKSGLTIPNPHAQAALMAAVYEQAGIEPNQIDYFEAHGTGTSVGDPIETHAIGLALGQKRDTPLPIGSVKSNLGHLESASGVAGLAKALNCLKHREVPATIGVNNPNPKINFADWNLDVVTGTRPLKKRGALTIGVNSFGFGGANAHVILQTPPTYNKRQKKSPKPPSAVTTPLVLSAKDLSALRQAADVWADFLTENPKQPFYAVAHSAFFDRERHSQGLVVFGDNPAHAAEQLRQFVLQTTPPDKSQPTMQRAFTGVHFANNPGVAFVYSGNGCQWQGMGRRLLAESATFRHAVTEVDVLFQHYANFSLLDELADRNGDGRYRDTEIAQPALFALQVGLTEVLREHGFRAVAVIGHSVGEVAAAWACGALSLAAAVKVIFYRSHHQGKTQGSGGMTAVGLNAGHMRQLLADSGTDSVHLAGINSGRGVTIAGELEGLSAIESELSANNTFFKRLDLAYAFHSPAMDVIESGLRMDLAELELAKPAIPFYSTVTGTLLPDDIRLDAEYWWHNVREPVQFAGAVNALLASGVSTLVEIGSHPVLQSYLNDALKAGEHEGVVIPTLIRNNDTAAQLLSATAQLLLSGVAFNHKRWFPVPTNRVCLPNYPWQREALWHPITSESQGLLYRHRQHPLLGYALAQHAQVWENQLDTQLQPFLADHDVGGAVVFPGAGFAELALAAAYLSQASEFIEIEELEIRAPLLLSHDASKVIRFNLNVSDGRLSLQSRELGKPLVWMQHCVGRIINEATGSPLLMETPEAPSRTPDFDGISHDHLTVKVGLKYGVAFQAIRHGWIEGDCALAELAMPQPIAADFGHYHLHPVMLDCAFQLVFQILKDELLREADIAFVPVKIGRLYVRSNKAVPVLAQAILLNRGPHSLKAEFRLFDGQGQAIAVANDVRFRAVKLHKAPVQALQYLAYSLTAAPLAPLPVTLDGFGDAVAEAVGNVGCRRYSTEVEPLLDSLCQQFAAEALQAFTDGQGLLSAEWFAGFVQSHSNLEGPMRALLAYAMASRVLVSSEGGGWQFNPDALVFDVSATAIWNALVQDYPEHFHLTHWVGRAGMHLARLLRGEVGPEPLDIGPSAYGLMYSHLLDRTCKTTLADALAAQCLAMQRNLPPGQRLRVLEIGAYSPEFAPLLCPQLDFNQSDYSFASFCEHALNIANGLREHFPKLHSVRLQAQTEASRQALGKNAHLAIVHLNFDNAQTLQSVLAQLSGLLQPGGQVCLIGQQPARWLDMVLGIAGEWWWATAGQAYASQRWDADSTAKQLQRLGFGNLATVEFMPGCYSGAYLLTAASAESFEAAKPQEPQRWLLLVGLDGREFGLAQALAGQLQAHGQHIALMSPDDAKFSEALGGAYDHIIHLSGFGQNDAQAQNGRCWLAATIARNLAVQTHKPTLWLLTSQVAALFACDQHGILAASLRADIIAHDAALWGFGRCLMNESSQYRVQLLDINGDDDPNLLAAISHEFLSHDAEREIVLTQGGGRFAPRLRNLGVPGLTHQSAPITVTEERTLRLGFKLPGQLRNLQWQEMVSADPNADELEVAVKATGLNFRDVMYTLGLLSDEAVENGFVGPTLGLEFAGLVTRIGANVTAFKPGDKVVGMGPACFSNLVLTKANALTLIPGEIGYAAAATIPSTFFTVYYALHYQARLQAGEKVLIHGAAGGVGIAAIQIARWLGAEIYATAGSDEKRDFLHLLGVKHIHDSRSLSFAEEILAKTGQRGVDVVLNSLAGEAINRNFRVLKPFGRFLELGKRDFYENTAIGLRPFRNNISYFGIDADQLLQERPELTQRLFAEMMQLFHNGDLHPLPYTLFDANQVVDAFRYMQQAKQIGKIVVTYEHGIQAKPVQEKLKPSHDMNISADTCYFVTGGLGGFGLRSAQWLVEQGARHLILIGKTGAKSPDAKAALAVFAAQGVNVHAAAVDVADKAALSGLLSHCQGIMPPLAGIIHAAAVIDDSLAANMTQAQLLRVLEPKIQGALNLHELTKDTPLDFFVLYSSVTALFGNPGQGNYVAANLWLEALAALRRQQGLPVTCIGWGPIDDVGFLARNEKIKESLQNRMGGQAMPAGLALAELGGLLQANYGTVGVVAFDWQHFSGFLPSAHSPKFSDLPLHAPSGEQGEDQGADIKRMLAELPDMALKAAFMDMLKEELGQILLVDKDKIDANRSMYDMGLDSLMGVELMIAIESRFRVQIPVMALSEASSINKLADRLLASLRGELHMDDNGTEAKIQDMFNRHDSVLDERQLADLAKEIETQGTNRIII